MPGKPMPNGAPAPNLYCAVIVKRVDEKTRSKTSINELLRDYEACTSRWPIPVAIARDLHPLPVGDAGGRRRAALSREAC